jgi:hypothetical protein
MIGGFAEYDAYAPLSIVDELALLMKQSSVLYRYEVHRSATGMRYQTGTFTRSAQPNATGS